MYLIFIFTPLLSFLIGAFISKKLGAFNTAYISTLLLFITATSSLFIFYEIVLCDSICYIHLFSWFDVGLLNIGWSCYFDSLSAVMGVMITVVSFCVHLFSINYMAGDFQHERFMSLLSLFTFFMIVLVLSDNFIQLLLGWEGVGICSYLLINFWFMRKNTNDSALKAVFFNRIGDLALLMGIFVIFYCLKSVDFLIVFDNYDLLQSLNVRIFHFNLNCLNLICFLFMIGAMAKSAQVFLQGWLGDAMEGPTPVSALIHAATMVTAGIYLLARCSPLFANAKSILILIIISGALTTLLCSLIGVDSTDLKKVIASSTASQLGYMFYTCGLAEFASAICHLFFHAFFKALLFLSAGAIIHTMSDEQDIRKMGGLILKLPLIFIAMSIGSFALVGLPFLGGFYSKDPLMEYSDLLLFVEELMTLFCCTLGALNTTFYSVRLLHMVFLGDFKGHKIVFSRIHDSSIFLLSPLIILILFTLLSFNAIDIFLGEGQNTFVFSNENLFSFREGEEDTDTFLFVLLFIFLGLFSFNNENFFDFSLFHDNISSVESEFFDVLKNFNYMKWFFDLIFIKFIVKLFYSFSDFLFLNFDRGFFEVYGPTFLVNYFRRLSGVFSLLQPGFIYHYVLFQVIFILIYVINVLIPFSVFLTQSFFSMQIILGILFIVFFNLNHEK
jgi:NADH-quinone oxidoreductase subunit L